MCYAPICPNNYTWSPFLNVYSRDSPQHKISADTIQPIHRMLLHGHANKAHFLNKHDEYLNKRGLSCSALLQCPCIYTERTYLAYSRNSCLFNISATTIQPSSQVLPHGQVAKADFLNKCSEFPNKRRVSTVLSSKVSSHLHSCLFLEYEITLSNVLPCAINPICQTLLKGHTAMIEFLNNCNMVLSFSASSYLHSQ